MRDPENWIELFTRSLPEEGEILDLGAGSGALAIPNALRGRAVVAVERDSLAFKRLRAVAGQMDNLSAVKSDIRQVDIPSERYAGIILSNVLQFLPRSQADALVERAQLGLCPAGIVHIAVFSTDDDSLHTLNGTGIRIADEKETYVDTADRVFSFYSLEDVQAWFAGWEILLTRKELVWEDHLPEGRHRHGIITLLARKPVTKKNPETVDTVSVGDAVSTRKNGFPGPGPGPETRTFPQLGVGLGLRRVHHASIRAHRHRFDILEVILDEFLEPEHRLALEPWTDFAPLVPHAVSLNLGNARGMSDGHLEAMSRAARAIGAPWISDHLCMTGTAAAHTNNLVPLPFTEESIELVGRQVERFRTHCALPLLLENITYYFDFGDPEFSEPEFLTRVLDTTDSGLLLDLCNLEINAKNHGYDPYQFLAQIPLERVVQVHLAGGRWFDGMYYDTHGHPVSSETWALYDWILRRTPVACVILERDQHIPPIEELLPEVDYARALFDRHRGKLRGAA